MDLSLALLVFGIGILLGGMMLYYFTRKSESFLMIQRHLQDLDRRLDDKLGESGRMMQNQFSQSSKIIQDVTEKLTRLDETNRQVMSFSEQLRNLQDILQNPKQRGLLGEFYLETLLQNVFPPGDFQMQYSFSDGKVVDAVVYMKDKIIPIDSKFSLENYEKLTASLDPVDRERIEKVFKQDLKNRIDETAKYIRPGEGTTDFAIMFIPAEAIYYDLLTGTAEL